MLSGDQPNAKGCVGATRPSPPQLLLAELRHHLQDMTAYFLDPAAAPPAAAAAALSAAFCCFNRIISASLVVAKRATSRERASMSWKYNVRNMHGRSEARPQNAKGTYSGGEKSTAIRGGHAQRTFPSCSSASAWRCCHPLPSSCPCRLSLPSLPHAGGQFHAGCRLCSARYTPSTSNTTQPQFTAIRKHKDSRVSQTDQRNR